MTSRLCPEFVVCVFGTDCFTVLGDPNDVNDERRSEDRRHRGGEAWLSSASSQASPPSEARGPWAAAAEGRSGRGRHDGGHAVAQNELQSHEGGLAP